VPSQTKRYTAPSRWTSKYRKDVQLWISSRKITYLYWFKFLQLAEQDPTRNVDWSKYQGWGSSKAVLGQKFDDWWESHWMHLFGVKNEGDDPRFPLTTKRPKTDAMRYALRLYENRHRGSTWEIALWFKKNERRMYFLDFFGKIDETKNIKTRLTGNNVRKRKYDEESRNNYRWDGGKSSNKFDTNSDAYLNRLDKQDVQRKVSRYLKLAESYLDNVCQGKFP